MTVYNKFGGGKYEWKRFRINKAKKVTNVKAEDRRLQKKGFYNMKNFKLFLVLLLCSICLIGCSGNKGSSYYSFVREATSSPTGAVLDVTVADILSNINKTSCFNKDLEKSDLEKMEMEDGTIKYYYLDSYDSISIHVDEKTNAVVEVSLISDYEHYANTGDTATMFAKAPVVWYATTRNFSDSPTTDGYIEKVQEILGNPIADESGEYALAISYDKGIVIYIYIDGYNNLCAKMYASTDENYNSSLERMGAK